MENQVLRGYFESVENYNDSFKKVCIRIFAFGKNANFSNITPQSFELAKNTIFSIPLVAKYIEDTTDDYGLSGNLSGHNTALRQKPDNSWEIYQDTIPLGCIPNDAEIYFEDVNEGTEENPDIKTYIVAKGCLLWMRYDAAQKINDWLNNGIIPKVSMEISNIQGSLIDNYFQVDNFQFSAVCCLGSEKTPCFQSCDISNYTKQDFEKSYSEMLKELKQLTQLELDQKNQLISPTLSDIDKVDNTDPTNIDSQLNTQSNFTEEGGNINLDKKLELIAKYANLTEEDIKDLKTDIDKYSLEEFDTKLKEVSEKKQSEFEMTNEQLKTEVYKSLSERQVTATDYWGEIYQIQEFRYCDIKDNMIITIDYTWSAYYGLPYIVSGDNINIDFEGKVEYLPDWRVKENGSSEFSLKDIVAEQIKFSVEKAIQKTKESFSEVKVIESQEYIDLQSKFTSLETEKTELQTKFEGIQIEFEDIQSRFSIIKTEKETLETEKADFETKCTAFEIENKELKTFKETTLTTKRKEAEDILFEMFSEKLTEDELKPVKDIAMDFSLEQLEEKLWLLAAKKTIKFEHNAVKPKVDFTFEKDDSITHSEKPYADIVSQYVSK
jgi:hypothetical protein